MWARKRPDIGWADLAYAASTGMQPSLVPPKIETVVRGWFPAEEALVCLSVRSGFDLLLQALDLPRGSEVILSAVTIPDILRIIEHHGLAPVPVEVDPLQLESSTANLASAISEKSRLILVAHLFGSQATMEPAIELARQYGLLVVEDCAQAFIGREFAGHEESDVSLFSFGPIKTATALGGAVVRVKNRDLRDPMRELQDGYLPQSRWGYGARVVKYALLKAASIPMVYGTVFRVCGALGINHDRLVSQLGRSFAGARLLPGIRKRPCAALQRLLARRIQQFDKQDQRKLQRRIRAGRFLSRGTTDASSNWPGKANLSHTYWVLAARTGRPARLVTALRKAGFDATTQSSLCDASRTRRSSTGLSAPSWLTQTVFLPGDPAMPARELRRLRNTILEFVRDRKRLPATRRVTAAGPLIADR